MENQVAPYSQRTPTSKLDHRNSIQHSRWFLRPTHRGELNVDGVVKLYLLCQIIPLLVVSTAPSIVQNGEVERAGQVVLTTENDRVQIGQPVNCKGEYPIIIPSF